MTPQQVAELEMLKNLKLVSSRARALSTTVADIVNVGVTFRTDGKGSAHLTHDLVAIESMNKMKNLRGGPLFPFRVVPVTLPKGASGADTPDRNAKWSDLDDIHLLYIPGGPTANDTQEGSSSLPMLRTEEEGFNRFVKPIQKPKETEPVFLKRMDTWLRINGEHVSRAAYELRLLGIARSRGIPILAVCAGSWRLLESYGGKVRTLEITARNKHKAAKTSDTWTIANTIKLVGTKTLIKLMEAKNKKYNEQHLEAGVSGINSTHWAVASTLPKITLTDTENQTTVLVDRKLSGRSDDEPGRLLDISAWDPDTDTVEAFESLYGAPTMGIQWHPESYLPGMLGETSGTDQAQVLSKALFELMGFAGQTAKRRADISLALGSEGRAFDLLCECARLLALRRMVGAGNCYMGACSQLSPAKWSARMVAVDEAIDLLGKSMLQERASDHRFANSISYAAAQRLLREYGVTI